MLTGDPLPQGTFSRLTAIHLVPQGTLSRLTAIHLVEPNGFNMPHGTVIPGLDT